MNGLKTLVQVCKITGVTRRAIQGYEKEGLVAAKDKNKYGHLLYDDDTIRRIERIKLYQQLGLKIREIKRIIDLPGHVLKMELQQRLTLFEIEVEEKQKVILKIREIIEGL